MILLRFGFSTRTVSSQTDVLKLFRKYYAWKPKRIYAYYNSQFDKIITQQHLQLMPIDERIATRAHAASNILSIKNQKIINMQAQISNLFNQAKLLAIQPCLKEDIIEKKIIDTVRAGFQAYLYENTKQDLSKQTFALRIIFSSGHGDFGIAARDNGCVFYAIIYEPPLDVQDDGVREYVSRIINAEIKDYIPSHTVNQTQNAMIANQAKKLGGLYGLKATKDNVLLQSSVGNLIFVFGRNRIVIPRISTIIPTSTMNEIMSYLKQNSDKLGISEVIERDINLEEAFQASQIMIVGNDKVIPILQLNGKQISNAKGQMTIKFQNWIQQFLSKGTLVEV